MAFVFIGKLKKVVLQNNFKILGYVINLYLINVQVRIQARIKPNIFLRFKPENILLNTALQVTT